MALGTIKNNKSLLHVQSSRGALLLEYIHGPHITVTLQYEVLRYMSDVGHFH
jgi:hypothetical protein